MKTKILISILLAILCQTLPAQKQQGNATFENPMIFADVPDLDIIRVDDTYYMVSTTMHFAPGCGIMKSKDLVNWEIINYAYDELDEGDNFCLLNGKSEYSQGSWAANLRYDPYEKMFYMIMTCNTTGKTYFYVTDDIENGKWHCSTTDKCYDPGLLFEDTGTEVKKYVLHPADTFDDHAMYLREISVDKDWNVTVGERHKVIDYANLENPARGLRAEGYHGYKIGDYYYIFMIQGCDGQRQEIVWRSKSLLDGQWEGRMVFGGEMIDGQGNIVMQTNGIGQGGIVQTPDDQWWCFLFKDYGSVGRMPIWLPMTWSADGWPVVGNGTTDKLPSGKNMTTPYSLPLPIQKEGSFASGIVQGDEFNVWKPKKSNSRFGSRYEQSILGDNAHGRLKPVWQWNHIPDMNGWSLTERKGWLRLKTTSVVKSIREARNTLTQRAFGPTCTGEVLLDASGLKNGDYAGISCFQNRYGFVGVKKEKGQLFVVMQRAMEKGDAVGKEIAHVTLSQPKVYLRTYMDFKDRTDKTTFAYSLDGKQWQSIGDTLKMYYDWPDFCGYRFALFHFATQQTGGKADFDWFRINSQGFLRPSGSKQQANYRNPVLPGFHADPSVCRAGDDFYLVNSTFQYYPGVPVFHSKDLIHWEQVGACLTRESQVRIEGMDEQTGIYAPTIRYHECRFYMVTTVFPSRKHFYVYTDNPNGEWSDPIYIDFCVGSCDPTLYFEDGRCYFLWKEGDINICEIDVKTGKQLGEIHHLGVGLGGRYPEGPHIYKKDGYYYLLLAEGGTEHGHHVNILRSKSLFGPYESNPANPILSHFSMKMQNSPIQGLGHADLIQAPDGSWWMICLGYRTHGYLQHVMGRETFLAPVVWEEGDWPVVNGDGTLQLDMQCQTLPQIPMPLEPSKDEFDTDKLSLYWSHLNMPQKENYSLTARKGWLRLKTSTVTLDEVGNPTFIGHRQSEANFCATTKVDVSGLKDGGVAGITAYAAHHNHYDMQIAAQGGKRYLQAKIRIGEMEHIEKEVPLNENIVYLRITADPQFYHLLYSTDNKEFTHLARMDYRYLSTETIGGFCGVHLGIFAHTLNKTISHADFDWTELKFDNNE